MTDRVYDDITQLLPNEDNPTPLVRINRLAPSPGFELWAKLEWMNPFGSVKDRAASFLIRRLEEEGRLRPRGADGPDDPGRGIVEPTSGNTGLSLAAIAGVKGYPMRAVVPNKVPLEKKVMLKLAGSELDVINDNLCPSPGMGDGSINLAKTYAKAQANRWSMPNQYENEANVQAHLQTTGPEIMRQTAGRVTHVFCSLGTCGTVTGLGRYFKEHKPDVRLFAVQPTAGHDVPGLRNKDELPNATLFDESLVEDVLEIDYELAYARAAELFRTEGLRAGPSSGLIFEGATRVARDTKDGVGVMIFCDDVFRYTHNMIKHLPELAEGTAAPNT
ncbi:MAG: PLP-dependent cysteine synthase family protein [Planctomycetota bacterium]